jgi:DNA-binding IscR family transcriptional regulator
MQLSSENVVTDNAVRIPSQPGLVNLPGRVVDGLAICSVLADGKLHDAGRLAQAQSIPGRRLELALAGLIRAGVVVSRRGRTGGYLLARPAEAIHVGEIIAALVTPAVHLGMPWRPSTRSAAAELAARINAAAWRTIERLSLTEFLQMSRGELAA